MDVKITPSQLQGTLSIPSSKSMAHRALICASLANGKSTITGVTSSKDIEATISCMRALGAEIQVLEDKIIVEGHRSLPQDIVCDCHESGSTIRFLIPVASLTNRPVTFIGQGRLMQRPMSIYEDIFKNQELKYTQDDTGIHIQGSIQAQEYELPGNVSSQFISGLLFSLPLLKEDSVLHIQEPYESRSYVNLTLQMLSKFGITILEEGNTYRIPGNQCYRCQDIHVEGDYSQMAFFATLASLQGKLDIANMDPDSKQGDKVILEILKQGGALVEYHDGLYSIQKNQRIAQTIDLQDCPDLGPILFVWASYTPGITHFVNAQRLRIKESDRIEAMETELRKWGVDFSSTFDTVTIRGKEKYDTPNVHIDAHNDHRIVMAMTVFALCAQVPCVIHDAQAITKSYPGFFDDVIARKGKVEYL